MTRSTSSTHSSSQPRPVALRPRRVSAPVGWFLAAAAFLFGISTAQFFSDSHGLDRILLIGLPPPFDKRDDAPERLLELAHHISALGSPEIVALISMVVFGFLLLAGRIRPALFLLVSVMGGTGFAYVLKMVFGSFRPHHSTGSNFEMLNTSFPSGHAMLAAIIYLTLAALIADAVPPARRPLLALYALCVAFAITLAVGASRVYLAVHWPSDVVAGWAVGASWIVLCWLLWGWLENLSGKAVDANSAPNPG